MAISRIPASPLSAADRDARSRIADRLSKTAGLGFNSVRCLTFREAN